MEDHPFLRDPDFRRFLEEFDLVLPDPSEVQERQSVGSGVIIDGNRGLVLTNAHVIEDADDITVTLKDRRSFKARLIGSDPGTDIAVLRIQPITAPRLRFGNSNELEVGDFVVAIGNPFGLGQTVTWGIVSAVGRTGIAEDTLGRTDPDRRIDQPRQFRRTADQPRRRGGRHQYRADRSDRRQRRHRLCGARQSCAAGDAAHYRRALSRQERAMPTESLKEQIKRELPDWLRSDPELRRFVLDLARDEFADKRHTEGRFEAMLAELVRDREEQTRKWEVQHQQWECSGAEMGSPGAEMGIVRNGNGRRRRASGNSTSKRSGRSSVVSTRRTRSAIAASTGALARSARAGACNRSGPSAMRWRGFWRKASASRC